MTRLYGCLNKLDQQKKGPLTANLFAWQAKGPCLSVGKSYPILFFVFGIDSLDLILYELHIVLEFPHLTVHLVDERIALL